MALINTSVPNLIQGVSQQPDATRFDGQCEEQVNALSSVAEGLKKRPNTRHIAKLLDTAIGANSFVHIVNRSKSEKYVLIHDGTKIQAWNVITGSEASINGDTGGYTPTSESYLDAVNPREDLKGLTVADTTFVLNQRKGIAINQLKTLPLEKEALILINQGDYEKRYQVNITANAIASGTSFTEATATVVLESYVYGSSETRVYYPRGTRDRSLRLSHILKSATYRWRVKSVTVGGAGEGYTNAYVNFSTETAIYANPSFVATIGASGNITGVNLTGSKGDFAGTGSDYYDQSGNTHRIRTGHIPPSISVALSPTTTTASLGANSLRAVIWSGSTTQGANSDNIAHWLTSSSVNSGINTSSDQAMNQSGSYANAITDLFDISRSGSLIKLTKKANWEGDFSITTTDSLSDTGMTAIYKEVSDISKLPAKCYDGFRCKVVGDSGLSQDDYYVQFQTNSGGNVGEGAWVECAGFDLSLGFDPSTMPVSFKNIDYDTFVFEELEYSQRQAGDERSSPNPSFVGSEINNIFFFKNRLGFLSNDNVILSEAGIGAEQDNGIFAYNFFRTTVSALLDSAPIDVSVSSKRVTVLESAIGFQDNLVLFSRTGQFILKGGDILTPNTISISPATNFDYDESVPPLPLGSYIYYPFQRGSFTGLREFTVNSSTDTYDSAEVTEHVPAYVPSNLTQLKGTTSEDIIALVSSNEPDTIYIYNYFWNNNQKVLSAWSKFTFTGEIRGMEFVESTLYMVMVNNEQTNLVEMPMESGLSDAAGYVTHLDMRVATAPDKIQLASVFTSAWTIGADDENLITYNDASNLSVRGVGDIATLTIPDTQTTISGAFTVGLIAYASTGNSLKIKDAGGNVLFSHAITSGQNTFSYTPTGSEIASSLCIYRQYDDDEFVPAHKITLSEINIVSETADGNSSTILLPYTPEDNTVQVYTTDGLALNCTNSGATVTLSSPLSTDTDVWAGIPYTMKYTFSEQLFKAKAGNGKSPSNAAKLMIRNGSLYFDKSAYFKVKVTPKFRDTYTNIFTPDVVGSSVIGSLSLDSGFYRFPVFTKAQDTTITIENESALPSTFQSAEFESFVHTRSNRYG